MTAKSTSSVTYLWLYLGVSALLLIPCFWLDHIEAGDLSSHIYNAWLATQIENGAAPGLIVVPLWTNTLSDVALQWLPHVIGATATERFVVGGAVLVFFWGAFCAVTAANGGRPWLLVPILAMLSYGLIFHLGFLNYYLATGLCLWAIALLWRPTRWRVAASLPILVLATLAHVLPLAWAASILAYMHLTQRFAAKSPWIMPGVAVGALGLLVAGLVQFPHRWSGDGIMSLNGVAGITGVEQTWLFGSQYLLISAGLLFLWLVLLMQRIDHGNFLRDPIAQLWLLHLVGFVILPSAIQFPQYQHVLAYIPQRISLLGSILLCMTIARTAHGRVLSGASALLTAIFFTFLYRDDRTFNTLENQIAHLVEEVPPGAPVVASMDRYGRINGALHILDRACVGHCFSYGNYEPATAQFRIRVASPNRVAASNMPVVQEIEEGQHVVTAQEAPLYSICLSDPPEGHLMVRKLAAGERICKVSLPIGSGP